MESIEPLRSKVSITLDLPPSCVQFCPAHPQYFVVGTYNLERGDEAARPDPEDETIQAENLEAKKPQSRNGSLVLFRTDGETMTQIQTLPQPSAILDLRFHPAQDRQDTLAVVSSTSSLAVFRIDPINSPQSPIIHIATSRCDDLGQDILFLQCNWHPLYTHTLGLTTSTGLARLVYLDSDWRIRDSRDLDIQNSLEAWSIAFSPRGDGEAQDDCTIYCGGDDSTLNYNTYQTIPNSGDEAWSSEAPFASVAIRGVHDAGVTAILPLACEDSAGGRLVVTGSYDDHIRLLAIHDLDKTYGMKRVKVLAEENLGGGVWRLDLVEHSRLPGGGEKVLILASCMHGGSRVVEMRQAGEDQEWTWMILARFEEHKSMNYGCSFVAQGDGSERRLQCVSTSFYDKLLCLWEYSPARAVELNENKP